MSEKTRIMKDETWYRHANPWSGWSRILSQPILYVPIWFLQDFIANPVQNWYVILGFILVAVWYAINPLIFPKPKNYDNWISKGVLGEKAWTTLGVKDINFAFGVVIAIGVGCKVSSHLASVTQPAVNFKNTHAILVPYHVPLDVRPL